MIIFLTKNKKRSRKRSDRYSVSPYVKELNFCLIQYYYIQESIMARFDTRKPERVSLSLGGRRINININNLIGEAKWAIDMILTNHFANSMFSSCYFCFLFVLFSFFERGRSNRRLQRQRVKNTSSWIWYRGHWSYLVGRLLIFPENVAVDVEEKIRAMMMRACTRRVSE
jgi:hypothetical protein